MFRYANDRVNVAAGFRRGPFPEEACGVEVFISKECFHAEPPAGCQDAVDFIPQRHSFRLWEEVRGHHIKHEVTRRVFDRERLTDIAHRDPDRQIARGVPRQLDCFGGAVKTNTSHAVRARQMNEVTSVPAAKVERGVTRAKREVAARLPTEKFTQIFRRLGREAQCCVGIAVFVVPKGLSRSSSLRFFDKFSRHFGCHFSTKRFASPFPPRREYA